MKKRHSAYLIILLTGILLLLGGCLPESNNPPTALITATPTSGEAPLDVSFSASSSYDTDGSIISYNWDYGDGNSGSGETASHTYNSAGTYTTELLVSDDVGATDTATQTITVSEPANQSPSASFTASPTSGEAPLDVSFDASASSDSDGTLSSYSWNFGDGNSGSGVTISHTYDDASSYVAQLTVTDNQGAMDSATKTITVLEPTLSPPAWIIGTWTADGEESLDLSFVFSSDNVVYQVGDTCP